MKNTLCRLLNEKNRLGMKDGPAIADETGRMFRMRDLDEMLQELLSSLLVNKKELFPEDIKNQDDIKKFYQCFRSFRRSSDTRALEQKLSSTDIDIVNRWRKVEAGQGRRPGYSMQQHYAQFDLLLKPFLRYTRAM